MINTELTLINPKYLVSIFDASKNSLEQAIKESDYTSAKALLCTIEELSKRLTTAPNLSKVAHAVTPAVTFTPKVKATSNPSTQIIKDTIDLASPISDEEREQFLIWMLKIIEEDKSISLQYPFTATNIQKIFQTKYDLSNFNKPLSKSTPGRFKWQQLISDTILKLVEKNLITKESRYCYRINDSYAQKLKARWASEEEKKSGSKLEKPNKDNGKDQNIQQPNETTVPFFKPFEKKPVIYEPTQNVVRVIKANSNNKVESKLVLPT